MDTVCPGKLGDDGRTCRMDVEAPKAHRASHIACCIEEPTAFTLGCEGVCGRASLLTPAPTNLLVGCDGACRRGLFSPLGLRPLREAPKSTGRSRWSISSPPPLPSLPPLAPPYAPLPPSPADPLRYYYSNIILFELLIDR